MGTKDEVAAMVAWLRPLAMIGADEAADMLAALQAKVEILTEERDQWIAHAKAAIWADSEECKALTEAVAEVRAELDQMVGVASEWRESAETSAADYHRALALNAALQARAEAAEAAWRDAERRLRTMGEMFRRIEAETEDPVGGISQSDKAEICRIAKLGLALLPTPPVADDARSDSLGWNELPDNGEFNG